MTYSFQKFEYPLYITIYMFMYMTVPKRCFFFGSLLVFLFHVCHAFLSVHYSIVVICWERADLLDLLYVMFLVRFFFTFLCGVLGQVQILIVLISDLCLHKSSHYVAGSFNVDSAQIVLTS